MVHMRMQGSYTWLWIFRLLLLANLYGSRCRPTTPGEVRDIALRTAQTPDHKLEVGSYDKPATSKERGLVAEILPSSQQTNSNSRCSMGVCHNTSDQPHSGVSENDALEQSHDNLVSLPNQSLTTQSPTRAEEMPVQAEPGLGFDYAPSWLPQSLAVEPEHILKDQHTDSTLRAGHIHQWPVNQREASLDLWPHRTCDRTPLLNQLNKQGNHDIGAQEHHRDIFGNLGVLESETSSSHHEPHYSRDSFSCEASKPTNVNENQLVSAQGIVDQLLSKNELELTPASGIKMTECVSHSQSEGETKTLLQEALTNSPVQTSETLVSPLEFWPHCDLSHCDLPNFELPHFDSNFFLGLIQNDIDEQSTYSALPDALLKATDGREDFNSKTQSNFGYEHDDILYKNTESAWGLEGKTDYQSIYHTSPGKNWEHEVASGFLGLHQKNGFLLDSPLVPEMTTEFLAQENDWSQFQFERSPPVSHWGPNFESSALSQSSCNQRESEIIPTTMPFQPKEKRPRRIYQEIGCSYKTTDSSFQAQNEIPESGEFIQGTSGLQKNVSPVIGNSIMVDRLIEGLQRTEDFSFLSHEMIPEIHGNILTQSPRNLHMIQSRPLMTENEQGCLGDFQEELKYISPEKYEVFPIQKAANPEFLENEQKLTAFKHHPNILHIQNRNSFIPSGETARESSELTNENSNHLNFSKMEFSISKGIELPGEVLHDSLGFIQLTTENLNLLYPGNEKSIDNRGLPWVLNWIGKRAPKTTYISQSPCSLWVAESSISQFMKTFNRNEFKLLKFVPPHDDRKVRARHVQKYLHFLSIQNFDKSNVVTDIPEPTIKITSVSVKMIQENILLLPSTNYKTATYELLLRAQDATFTSLLFIRLFNSIFSSSPMEFNIREQQFDAWKLLSDFWSDFPFYEITGKKPKQQFSIRKRTPHEVFVVNHIIYYLQMTDGNYEASIAWNLLSIWIAHKLPNHFNQFTDVSGEISTNLKLLFNILLYFSSPKMKLSNTKKG